jgi:hypothetical protein
MEEHPTPAAVNWCIVETNNAVFRAGIVHVGRGKYKIIQDNKDGNFVGQIIDASDILQCET